jgi:alpha-ketoglutarate-dependent sulfate ester dioxygenase
MSTRLEISKVTERIGAVVDGVRLGGDLDAEVVAQINAALLEHKVIFFRGQDHLDGDGQLAFAARLGTVTASHPTIRMDNSLLPIDSDGAARGASVWHTDVTFIDRIPKASILRAITIPAYGGTTMWANTAAGYESLPRSLRVLADELWALHTNQFDYIVRDALGKDPVVSQYITSFSATRFETEHPVVRVHPETGERALLLGGFARHLIGLTTSESAAILGVLQARATIPDHTVRWNWSASDVAIWDNRATQHCAVADYGAQRRSLSRITLAGDIPVGVTGERSRVIAGDASDFSSVAEPGLPSPSAVSPG